MPRTPAASSKKQPLTFAQLAAYDDILTDVLVDHAYYWTTVPKNRPSYRPSRGVQEEQIAKVIQTHLIVDPDLAVAEEKLLATDGLRKFFSSLKTPKERDDFKAHMRRYMSIYLPDCPFEVNATNRYTIDSYEASITARRFIKRNEPIKYLSGIQVTVTPEEEAQLTLRKKDFSLVVSSRSKLTSLFMGPARFANHDCEPNARLVTRGQAGIELIATKNIGLGEEITITYSESYFGENNCDCLCQTCEDNLANGWKPEDGAVLVHRSIEGGSVDMGQGYSLRRRKKDRSESIAAVSRTRSPTPDIRPRVLKSQRSHQSMRCHRASTSSTDIEGVIPLNTSKKRDQEAACFSSPPITPAKRQKTNQYIIPPILLGPGVSRASSEAEFSSSSLATEEGKGSVTDATTPEFDKPDNHIMSPELSPVKQDPEPAARLDSSCLPKLSGVARAMSISRLILPTTEVDDAGHPYDPAPPSATAVAISLGDGALTTQDPTTALEHSQPHNEESSTRKDDYIPAKETPGTDDAASGPKVEHASDLPSATPASRAYSKKRQVLAQRSAQQARKHRVPGDYTETPLLLSEPEMAWIRCTNCYTSFVQKDAYYTRANCYRCERHSKLYGYVWPKTEKAGKNDKEERVLDHRLIHRFLHPEDEAKARGRKHWSQRPWQGKEASQSEEPGVVRGRGRAPKLIRKLDRQPTQIEGLQGIGAP